MQIGDYETHPAADIFPMMDDEAFAALCVDVREQGLREAVWLLGDLVLDGRNRLRACLEVGVEPRFRDYDGDDPVGFVVSMNIQRRHLDESQRAMVAARVATLAPWRPAESAPNGGLSQPTAAALLNVGPRTVQRARVVLDRGAPELVEAVDGGDIAVSAAVELADYSHDDQAAVVQMIAAGEAKNVRQAKRRLAEEKRAAIPVTERADCRIVLGDAVAQVMALEAAPHCVVTDPPYGIDTHNTRRGGMDYADGEGYALALLARLFAALREKCDPSAHLYVFSGYTHAHAVKALLAEHFDVQDNPIVWVKDNHTMCDFAKWYPSKHEYVWFAKMPGSKRELASCVPDVLTVKRDRETTHSAEKPVELLKTLIEQSTEPGELVLDPFCGSGSTGVAASQLSRAFVGIESDTAWVGKARTRVA